jgi:DNA sulfur modification protein DndB
VIDTYLQQDSREWKSAKKIRPSDAMIRREYKRISSFWDMFIQAVPALKDLEQSTLEDQKASAYRNRNGGHLLYRPAGLMIVIEVIKSLLDEGYALEKIVSAVAKVPMQLANEPWAGLLWDVTNRRMIMSLDNRTLAARLLVYGLTGDQIAAGKTYRELRKEWAGILGKSMRSVTIPSWSKLNK